MVQERTPIDSTPPPATPLEMEQQEQASTAIPSGRGGLNLGGGNSGGMIKTAIISLVVVVVVLMLASLAGGVFFETPGTSKKNFDNLLSAVNDAKTQSNAAASSVASQLAGLDSKINSAVTTGVNQATSQLSSQISSINSKVSDLTNSVTQGNASLNTSVNSVKTQIAAMQTTVDSQNQRLNDLDARLKKLETASLPSTSPPTITSFTPTTGTSGAVVTITGTNFIGATLVTFGGTGATSFVVNSATQITATVDGGATGAVSVATPSGTTTYGAFTYTGTATAGSVSVSGIGDLFGQPYVVFTAANFTSTSRQFVFTVTNGTGKTISGIQFLVALQALTSDYQPTELPTDAIIKITSASLIGTLWQQQQVGGGVYAFTNQVLSGVLSGLGTISQNSGSQQYSISVTVSTTNTPINAMYLYPTVKVLNYN